MNICVLLKQIHDEADHILGTEAENFKEIARKNAQEIKRLAKKALKMSPGGTPSTK